MRQSRQMHESSQNIIYAFVRVYAKIVFDNLLQCRYNKNQILFDSVCPMGGAGNLFEYGKGMDGVSKNTFSFREKKSSAESFFKCRCISEFPTGAAWRKTAQQAVSRAGRGRTLRALRACRRQEHGWYRGAFRPLHRNMQGILLWREK